MSVTFEVRGDPKPAGSKRAIYVPKLGRAVVIDDCKRSKDWKGDVKRAAVEAMRGFDMLLGPVELEIIFTFSRPKAHYGTGKNEQVVKARSPKLHVTKPDLDKLYRCAGDAMTGVVWRDDAQVARSIITKRYGDEPGAIITVRPLTGLEDYGVPSMQGSLREGIQPRPTCDGELFHH